MSRVYSQTPAPFMISTAPASSHPLGPLDLMDMNSDSMFLLTLARSNFSVPTTPTTPTTQSTFGSTTFYVQSPTISRQSGYSLFADREETAYRGAPIWPTGFLYEGNDEYQPLNPYVAATPSRTSSSGSYPRGQAVEVHHGTARIAVWVKKAFKKVTPRGWRRLEDETSKGRMILD